MSLYVAATRSRRLLASYERSPRIVAGDLAQLRKPRLPANADACIVLLEGESLLHGSMAEVRHSLREPGARTFVPVHVPVLPEFGLDLISLQPRWFSTPPHSERIDTRFRIAAAPARSRAMFFALRDSTEPWAVMAAAVADALNDPDAAKDRLRRLWQLEELPPVLRSLVLRNLIAIFIVQQEYVQARELLDLGVAGFPEYAELRWLSGVLWLIHGKYAAALREAERARGVHATTQWIGSGGESGYRSEWLMGIGAEIGGNQEMAVNHFMAGVSARPAYGPSIAAILNLRLPANHVKRLSWELCALARREPLYRDRIFEYLLFHRCFSSAQRLTDSAELQARAAIVERPFLPATASGPGAPLGVVIEAPFLHSSSAARIAGELATGLMADPSFEIALEPHGYARLAAREVPHGVAIAQALLRHPRQLDLTIRLCWPPDFRRPSRGRLAHVFPWEYEGVPKLWIRQMRENVDEVWVPSQFVAGVFERAGLDREQIRVIPNGIDPAVFSPQGPTADVAGARRCMFLFVGGAIARKGFDLLLDAYGEAFTSSDDVTLMVKESGSSTFYSHNSLLAATRRFESGSRLPHLILNTENMNDATLAGLYRRADCLVHPYRGEGFGMPLAEAMACGVPVITTARGPAPEFCTEATGWLISATNEPVPDDPPPVGEMSEPLGWFEPSFEELVQTMRYVYEHRDEAALRGAEAARSIHQTHTWPQIINQYAAAARRLCGAQAAVCTP